ncbi:MAG: GIY-YIG nuclease family protein [Bacteriovoracales bacterium]
MKYKSERPYRRKYSTQYLLEYALKFETRKELMTDNMKVYWAIRNRGIAKRAFSHMQTSEGDKFRCIYGIFFPNKKVYFGLTGDFNKRKKEHIRNPYNKNIKREGGLAVGKMIQITDYLSEKEAQKFEGKKEQEFEFLGWEIFNLLKTGGLGGRIVKWPKYEILKAASKCESFNDFSTKYPGADRAMRRLGISKEVLSIFGREEIKHWNKFEDCLKAASECKNRNEYSINYPGAYLTSRKNNWLIIFFPNSHQKFPAGYWDIKENSAAMAKKCKNRFEFQITYRSAYKSARRNGWLDEFFPEPWKSENSKRIYAPNNRRQQTHSF